MAKVEFEFPDPDDEQDTEIEIEPSSAEALEAKKPEKKQDVKEKPEESELDIEVIDDTPEADRGKKPSEPPEDVTDDELAQYSEKVQKRIKRFTKGYHDERRAKEAAQRERDELEHFARQMREENERLKSTVGQSRTTMLDHAKRLVERDLNDAQREYRDAHEEGNSEKLLEAQKKLNLAQYRSEQLRNINPDALQAQPTPVQERSDTLQEVPQPPQPDEKALRWRDNNTWFGQDQEMTALALGYHTKMVESGVDPNSDEYYEKLDARMRKVFPDQFEDIEEEPDEEPPKPKSTVVAPVTRSTAPKRVRLTHTQVAIAKRLGVPLEEYAKQVAEEMRKANG